jgi:hypothetical protein
MCTFNHINLLLQLHVLLEETHKTTVRVWWHGVDDVNDRPVGNPKRRCDEHSSKFSLSYETKVCYSGRKKPNSRR